MVFNFLNVTEQKKKLIQYQFGVSAVLFIALYSCIRLFWFPGQFISIDGGWSLILIVALLTIVLGPVLTLLLMHPDKKTFKKDWFSISLLQVAIVTISLFLLNNQKTSLLVFSGSEFFTVSKSMMLKKEHQKLLTKKLKENAFYYDVNTQLNVAYIAKQKSKTDKVLITNPALYKNINAYWKNIQPYQISNSNALKEIRSMALMSGIEYLDYDVEIYRLTGKKQKAYLFLDSQKKQIINILPITTSL